MLAKRPYTLSTGGAHKQTRHNSHGGGVCACSLCMRARSCVRVYEATYSLSVQCMRVCTCVCVYVCVCTYDRMHVRVGHRVVERMNLLAGERVKCVVLPACIKHGLDDSVLN